MFDFLSNAYESAKGAVSSVFTALGPRARATRDAASCPRASARGAAAGLIVEQQR
jgi:hypothetical protein